MRRRNRPGRAERSGLREPAGAPGASNTSKDPSARIAGLHTATPPLAHKASRAKTRAHELAALGLVRRRGAVWREGIAGESPGDPPGVLTWIHMRSHPSSGTP